jgi:hypothetical protein
LKLITNHFGHYHVSLDNVKEFEKAILQDSRVVTANSFSRSVSRASYLFWQLQIRSGLNITFASKKFNKVFKSNEHYFSVLMGPNFRKCFPYFYFSGQKSLYMFDAWPRHHEIITKFLDAFDVNHIFVSSSQVADKLQGKLPKTKCYWIPEGIDINQYRFTSYEEKDIDVLALGRKYDAYHEQIAPALINDHKTYLYEKVKGEIIFPTREEFIDGLSRSKISICVPASITHPKQAENIQTMTIRYLQSMVSKCLIVGHAPKEMINLFGYNPVIEIEMQNPYIQLSSILGNYKDYFPLIEKNYTVVAEEHSWRKRWKQIAALISMV